ncbi:MAG: hypothetical protein MI741_13510 [Rhodospirillales bacterium]|nr:hypothetical protein [Rhodospirillales bacterium]
MNPFADHRDLYLLVAGLVVGVLLSSAVLGRIAPKTYQSIFFGDVAEVRAELEAFDEETTRQIELLSSPELTVTPLAIEEKLIQRKLDKADLERKLDRAVNRTPAALFAITFAILAVMVAETLISPSLEQRQRTEISPAVARLVRLRYGLLAIWLAIIVARHDLLASFPIVMFILLLILAGVIGFVPLGKRATS